MMPRAGTRLGRVKKLARVGSYTAMCATGALVLWPGRTWVAVGCAAALAALSSVAAIAELHADGLWRGWRRKGSGLSGRGRDDVSCCRRGGAPVAHAGRGVAADARFRWPPVAGGSRTGPRTRSAPGCGG